jgi:hypothetical protein
LFERVMSEDRHSLFEQLGKEKLTSNFYLAGGTAVALYLGHRLSNDLDFFSAKEFDSFALGKELSKVEGFVLTGQEEGTLHCMVGDIKISYLYYPYSLLCKEMDYKYNKIASLQDIALMKLVALV